MSESDDSTTPSEEEMEEVAPEVEEMLEIAQEPPAILDFEEVNDDDEEKQVHVEPTFDRTLPRTHSYLGTSLRPRAINVDLTALPEGFVLERVALFPLGGVLFPHERIPLRNLSMAYRDAIVPPLTAQPASRLDPRALFGVVRALQGGLARVGTSATIEATDITSDAVIARGRQRFRLTSFWLDAAGVLRGMGVILSDGPLLGGPFPRSLLTTRATNTTWRGVAIAHPAWICDNYDSVALLRQARALVAESATAPESPDEFLVWLLGHCAMDEQARQSVLEERSPVARLLRLVGILRRDTKDETQWSCAVCAAPFARCNARIEMSAEGSAGHLFVNPHGSVHQLLTLRTARGLRLDPMPPSTESSWFSGYAWRIAYCAACTSHIGWRFTATSADLHPEHFYGLSLNAVTLRSQHASITPSKDLLDPLPRFDRSESHR